MDAVLARWHVGHKNGEYGILPLSREQTQMMGYRLEWLISRLCLDLATEDFKRTHLAVASRDFSGVPLARLEAWVIQS
jgi:hypothetical protein